MSATSVDSFEKVNLGRNVAETKLFTAITTPFTKEGKIDVVAFDKHVQHQVDNGVEGLVIASEVGDSQYLHFKERLSLIQHAVREWGPKLAIVGNPYPERSFKFENTKAAFADGMHAALLLLPDKAVFPDANELVKHLKVGLDCGPSILVNKSKDTPIPQLLLDELKKHENFIGVVESAGSEMILSHKQQGIVTWAGNDSDLTDRIWARTNDKPGVISATANLLPGVMSNLVQPSNVIGEWDSNLAEKIQPFSAWLQEDLISGPTAKSPIVAWNNVSHSLGTLMILTGVRSPYFRGLYGARSHKDLKKGIEILGAFKPEEIYGGMPCNQMGWNQIKNDSAWETGLAYGK